MASSVNEGVETTHLLQEGFGSDHDPRECQMGGTSKMEEGREEQEELYFLGVFLICKTLRVWEDSPPPEEGQTWGEE